MKIKKSELKWHDALSPLSLPEALTAASETPGIPYTHRAYVHFVPLFLTLFFLFLLLFSASKSAPARRTSLHTLVLSTRVSILPSLPLTPLSLFLSRALFLFFLYGAGRSMGRGPIRTHVALVGKIEARHASRLPRVFWASRRIFFASIFETSSGYRRKATRRPRKTNVARVAGYVSAD